MITVPLAELVRPAGKRAGVETALPVYSVTKHAGFVPSLEYFKKQVFSRDVADYKLVEPGDFAYATIHLDEGSIGIAPERGLISPMYTVFRTDDSRVDPHFLVRYLKSGRALAHYPQLGKGAVHRRKAISLAALGSLPVPLPPIPEQRRIAAILDHADALRTKRRQVLTNLDTLTQSIFHDMFGVPMAAGRWPMRALGDLARIVRGASPRPAGDPRYFGGPIPWLKISDITSEASPVVRTIVNGVTEAGRDRSVLLPPGTLVLTNSATVGVPRIIEPATCIHDGFLAFLDLSDEIDKYWLQSALALSRDRLVALAPEGTQKNLNGPIVKSVEVGIPPIESQREFLRVITAVNAQRSLALDVQGANTDLFKSIQNRAFRGEL